MKSLFIGLMIFSLSAEMYSQREILNQNKITKTNTMNYSKVQHKLIDINGVTIFYREAGNPSNETVLMLHGFPSSSHMYREIIDGLANDYHIIAPDYPGFGFSDTPSPQDFEYTFDNISKFTEAFIKGIKLDKFYLMMQDYGGPIGMRIATKNPKLIEGLIIQNANTYMEGLTEWPQKIGKLQEEEKFQELTEFKNWLMSRDGLKEMYLGGAKNPSVVDPISYLTDEAFLKREGVNEIQTVLFKDYGSNFPKYPEWQEYLKTEQPKTLVIWGKNDKFFGAVGATAYKKDLKDVEVHIFDGGHFVLEEYSEEAIDLIKKFIEK